MEIGHRMMEDEIHTSGEVKKGTSLICIDEDLVKSFRDHAYDDDDDSLSLGDDNDFENDNNKLSTSSAIKARRASKTSLGSIDEDFALALHDLDEDDEEKDDDGNSSSSSFDLAEIERKYSSHNSAAAPELLSSKSSSSKRRDSFAPVSAIGGAFNEVTTFNDSMESLESNGENFYNSFSSMLEDKSFQDLSSIQGHSHRTQRASMRVSMIDDTAIKWKAELDGTMKWERLKEWASAFRRSDPRYRIMEYFNDAATSGIDQVTSRSDGSKDVTRLAHLSPIINMFARCGCFTVWRPTSNDSIRKMILGEGVGKGLDIKGKSAKKGYLSGFVPFMQIYKEQHKSQIRCLPKKSAMRIFFSSEEARDMAAEKVAEVGEDMQEGYYKAYLKLGEEDATEEEKEEAMQKLRWEMVDPEIVIEDIYAHLGIYGLEIPERLFWEAFVVRQSIDRPKDSEYATGRPSLPAFQDMNFASLRNHQDAAANAKGGDDDDDPPPRPVIYQYSKEDFFDPRMLIMAYEEKGTVRPVVSDFDCFLVGTRAVQFKDPIPEKQEELLNTTLGRIERILSGGASADSWTERWIDVLREDSKGSYEMPRYGFGDPKSYSLMKMAVSRLEEDGSVRHGAECFNYIFPQELDDYYLVIGDNLQCNVDTCKVWAYVDVEGLQEILLQKIKDGYTFPLNPKWVLCDDPGWKEVYDALLQSKATHVQSSLDCWYPGTIRDTIERIRHKYPKGFVSKPSLGRASLLRCSSTKAEQEWQELNEDHDEYDGTAAMDLARHQLKYYHTLQRAKKKLKVFLIFMSFINDRRRLLEQQQEIVFVNEYTKNAMKNSQTSGCSSNANTEEKEITLNTTTEANKPNNVLEPPIPTIKKRIKKSRFPWKKNASKKGMPGRTSSSSSTAAAAHPRRGMKKFYFVRRDATPKTGHRKRTRRLSLKSRFSNSKDDSESADNRSTRTDWSTETSRREFLKMLLRKDDDEKNPSRPETDKKPVDSVRTSLNSMWSSQNSGISAISGITDATPHVQPTTTSETKKRGSFFSRSRRGSSTEAHQIQQAIIQQQRQQPQQDDNNNNEEEEVDGGRVRLHRFLHFTSSSRARNSVRNSKTIL